MALFEGSNSSVVNENEEEVETADSDPENGEEVQSTTQVQTKTRNQKMEIHAFLNLTDGPLSYRNHYTLWTTTQDLQQISNVKVNLLVSS